jgi:hypothetical protein
MVNATRVNARMKWEYLTGPPNDALPLIDHSEKVSVKRGKSRER